MDSSNEPSNSLREDNTPTRIRPQSKSSIHSYKNTPTRLCNQSKSSIYSYKSRMFDEKDNQSNRSKTFIGDFSQSCRKSSLHEEIALFKTIPLPFHLLLLLVYTFTCLSGYYTLYLPNTLQKPLLDIGVSASDTIRLKTIFSVAGLITLPISGIMINKVGDGPSIL